MHSANTPSFSFIPVKVTKGRKWKGEGYMLDSFESSFQLYGWHGGAGRRVTETAKIWDPAAKRIAYASCSFCEDRDADTSKVEADRKEYIDLTIQSTISWCRSRKPNAEESEVLSFARNVLRKNHPEMIDAINVAAPDTRDVVSEIERTVTWAMGLKTRPCYMYGRHCPGGKPLPDKKKVAIALKSLTNKGITKLEGFSKAWELILTLKGLRKELDTHEMDN